MSDERKVQEILARYVRATDRRDGKTQGALFTDEAVVQISIKTGPDSYEPFGQPLIGGAGVEYAVTNFMSAHPEGGSSHHTTFDHIIGVSVAPGAIAFTRIPCDAYSTAKLRTRLETPPLEAA